MPSDTISLANEDNISNGDDDDSKVKINFYKCDRTSKCVNNGKRLCNGDAKISGSKCQDFTFAFCVPLVTFTIAMNDF